MKTFEETAAELAQHHNEVCLLYGTEIVRLIGYGRDDEDQYYIVQKPQNPRPRGGDPVIWSSAVGHILPLKGHLPKAAYASLAADLARKGCAATEHFATLDRSIWDREASSAYHQISRCRRLALTLDPNDPEARFALYRRFPESPELSETLILRGEAAPLDQIARSILAEMEDWEAGQREDGRDPLQAPAPQTTCSA